MISIITNREYFALFLITKISSMFSFRLTSATLFVLNTIILLSQSHLESPAWDNYHTQMHSAVVTGKIINCTEQELSDITITAHVVYLGSDSQRAQVVQVNDDGSFRLTLEKSFTYQQVWLSIPSYYFGQLMLHDSIDILIDASLVEEDPSSFDSPAVIFRGPDGSLTSHLNKFTSYWQGISREIMSGINQTKMSRSLPVSRKVHMIDSLYKKRFELIDSFHARHGSEHEALVRNEEMSDYLGDLALSYINVDVPDTRLAQILDHAPFFVSNAGYGYYNRLGFLTYPNRRDTERVLKNIIREQRSFSKDSLRIDSFVMSRPEDKGYSRHFKYFHKLNEIEYSKAIWSVRRDKFSTLGERKSDLVKVVQIPEDPSRATEFAEHMLPTISTDWVYDKVEKAAEGANKTLQDIEESLASAIEDSLETSAGINPIVLPNGSYLIEAVGKDAPTFINAIREQFTAKTIILDVWATWCGPCIRDMKESKETVSQLADQDIEVVYLCASSSSTKEQWKKKVAELDLPTWHYHLDAKLSGQLMDFFELGGYPSHVVLLSDGTINKAAIHRISGLTSSELWKRLKN